MKFYDSLPLQAKFDSKAIIDELKQHPDEWGEFWVQGENENPKQARQKATSLRSYIKRQQLPVSVQVLVDDAGLVRCFARWTI